MGEVPAMPLSRWMKLQPLLLFFAAPLIGEFLLGNLPITWLYTLVVLAPLYGGGAILVRELALRMGAGWPGIFMLGLAFGVIEEGFVTQSLFNPDYLGMRLLDYGYLPTIGISAWWTVFVLGLHTIWSTTAAIALVEALAPRAAGRPWLGPLGLAVAFIIFLAGCAGTYALQPPGFVAAPLQFASAAAVVLLLVAAAWLTGRRRSPTRIDRFVPSPWVVGAFALAAGSLFMLSTWTMTLVPAAANAGFMLLVMAGAAAAILRWSRSSRWGARHVLGLTAGALITYGWWGFLQAPSVPGANALTDTIGNAVFCATALAVIVFAARRLAAEGGAAA